MINSKTTEYYHASYGMSLNYLSEYISNKAQQDRRLNCIIISFLLAMFIFTFVFSKPIFAYVDNETIDTISPPVHKKINFEQNIKNKYQKAYITFPAKGIAHIKKTKYVNNKPIKINIVEINTKINKNLSIKPQIASSKLNNKRTIRKIAQQENAIVAINGGYFKPQTGVPLGALMIDKNVLTGPIFNRVGIAIFDDGEDISFKMDNINFDIMAYTKSKAVKIDNINQPRMLSTYTLMYTPIWGKFSPPAPKYGYNMLVVGNKITKISANAIEFLPNSVVISAPKAVIVGLAKNNKEIYIDIKLQESLSGANHIIGAGPYLVKDGQIYVDYKEEKLTAISGKNPRSAIGYKNDGSFMIVTIDGREQASVGMTLYELARFMKEIGCEYAMNFDGGSSSALYVDGKIANSAHNKEGIAISNALIVSEENSVQISSL